MPRPVALALIALLAAPAAFASDCVPAVHDGWVRLPPAQMPMTAGFGRIGNDCAAAVTVVAAGSPAFEAVELHETREIGGVNRMRHVPELQVDANASVELRPGGLHLMLMRPLAPLAEGDTVPVVLELSDGRKVDGRFEVRRAARP